MSASEIVKVPADEASMRAFEVPWLKETADLVAMIEDLATRPHDYGTCVYAVSIVATAAFNLMASRIGITGFQASCADMDILRRTRGWEGPAMILDGAKAVYPQYDLRAQVEEWLTSEEFRQWCADEARKLIAERNGLDPHPDVAAHWKRLADSMPPKESGS